ncbi:hydrogenase maturation nickel metallochaperone HypA [Corynebacterium lactis]|uniref:Hydrogenase expression protein HupK n=1 Tax=Corynebacterium lactis RW2-5 TaxID=1408189 RepID=A0A0K2GYG3_9CORY|nr:hydrogenase maturation nickel metallochaperone HypA [Corynebacterium lactis]ALA66820.1 hydrogenase expression protein HupK [Corynebacterium lactis RW2-5]
MLPTLRKGAADAANLGFVHEVALSMQLAKVVTRAAEGRTVRCVHLRIGALRQVVPETLSYAWNFVSRDASLGEAKLDIDWVPAVIECPLGHRSEVGPLDGLVCPECSQPGHVISGEEFTIVDIDVDINA